MLKPRTGYSLMACVLLLSILLGGCDAAQSTATPTAANSSSSSNGSVGSTSITRSQAPDIGAQSPETPPLTAAPLRDGSIAKIETALSEGRIDQDTALFYLVVATYDPSSLPAEFKSDVAPATMEATILLASLSGRLDKLPPTLREEVQSFLRRPTDPRSFWYKRLTGLEADTAAGTARSPEAPTRTPDPNAPVFQHVDSAGTNVRIWYMAGAGGGATAKSQAEKLAAEADRSDMWRREKQVMLGHEPCSDADLDDNGGDGRLDVYIVPRHMLSPRNDDSGEPVQFESAGLTIPLSTGGQCPAASFLLVNKSLSFDNLRVTLAHELFHAFQFSFNTPYEREYETDYGWWMEASATWAEDLIYPDLNSEWIWLKPGGWADKDGPSGPLDAFTRGGYEQYAAYIWPFYLTHRPGGDPQLVGRIMQAGEGEPIIQAMSNMPDWPVRFKDFALWNWNKPSAQKYNDGGKGIQPLEQKAVPLAVSPVSGQVSADVDLQAVSIRYYTLTVSDDVQRLRLDLGGITSQSGAGVQAVVTISDPHNPGADRIHNDDWSDLSEKVFCRNVAGEAVSNVVLVVSNSLLDDGKNLTGQIIVHASDQPCSVRPAPPRHP